MRESRTRFLTETDALIEIRSALRSASRAKLAVAFWGAEAMHRLGLDRSDLTLEVICNLDSGACNPDEIAALMASGSGRTVRTNPRLHAKVYWTPDMVILGSSNASANGLVVEGHALVGWAEANVLIEDAEMIREIEAWFDALPADAITAADLERAQAMWDQRRRMAPTGQRQTGDLMDAYRGAPDHPAWERVRLALWTAEADAEAEPEADAAKADNAVLAAYNYYQDWNTELRPLRWVIDIDLSGGPKKLTYQRLDDPPIQGPRLTYVMEAEAIEPAGFLPLKLAAADRRRLLAGARELFRTHAARGAEGALIELKALAAFLDGDAPAAPAEEREAFRAALRRTYEVAKLKGYQATRFLQIIDGPDPIGGARGLLRLKAQIPSGFTELALLGKLDVSVEALALEDRWRHLFDEVELREARRRLGRR